MNHYPTPYPPPTGQYPATRLRRLRQAPWVREMTQESRLHPSDLIWPLFVQDGKDTRTPIPSMPGVFRLTVDQAVAAAREARSLGIPAIALFPATPAQAKDDKGSEALNPGNLICRALHEIKAAAPEIGLIADVALDPYTSHGMDGLVENGEILNDETVEILCQQAVLQARAGCDVVAPSDMMDGRVGAIRGALEQEGLKSTLILSYAAKYASALYGPFREAVDSAKHLGGADKKTFQMHPPNAREALREAALDVAEGADMLMVKPAGLYLDILRDLSAAFPLPVLAYQVSGEYAMIKAAEAQGWLDGKKTLEESLFACKRAGAAAIFTYAAPEIARTLQR